MIPPELFLHADQQAVFLIHQLVRLCEGMTVSHDAVIAAGRFHAGPFADQAGVELLHGQMVAVAHDGQQVLHVVAFGEFRVGALGETVADFPLWSRSGLPKMP